MFSVGWACDILIDQILGMKEMEELRMVHLFLAWIIDYIVLWIFLLCCGDVPCVAQISAQATVMTPTKVPRFLIYTQMLRNFLA